MLLLLAVVLAIAALIWLTVKVKLHPFFALVASSFVFAILSGMNFHTMLDAFSNGFGGTAASIGVVIAIGTVIGALLESSGASESMARSILKVTGEKHASLGLAITGYFVSIPVFCDSAFVLLSSLAKRLSRDTKTSMTTMAIALAMGLHATHMLVPPTPGPLGVAGILKADLGMVIVLGSIVSIPVMLVGWLMAKHFGKKYEYFPTEIVEFDANARIPSAAQSFLPIVLPIFFMLLGTFAGMEGKPFGTGMFADVLGILGTPIIALLIGLCIALWTYRCMHPGESEVWTFEGDFGHALKTAGQIVLIVGAGGAFGAVLKASPLKDILVEHLTGLSIGILAPFIIGAIFRTAIGSGTVAMVTAASMLLPVVDALGFNTPIGLVVAMLACASGGFMVFHGNDDFFWVVSSSSEMPPEVAYKVIPVTSVVQSFVSLACTYVLYILFV